MTPDPSQIPAARHRKAAAPSLRDRLRGGFGLPVRGLASLLRISALAALFAMPAAGQAESPFLAQVEALASSPRGLIAGIKVVHEAGGRVAWSKDGKWIAMDRKHADGYYDVSILRPDGSNERCITCDANAVLGRGHHGQPAWHPTGRYIVFQSQKAEDAGHIGRDIAALPGAGHHSDLWLADLETGEFHRLTQTAPGGASGVLHPHFSRDGRRLSWTDGLTAASLSDRRQFAGFWQLKLADFRVTSKGPELHNVTTLKPGGDAFYENHGFTKDGGKLIFTSSFEMGKRDHFLNSTRIYEVDLTTNKVTRLAAEGYNETAHVTPDGEHIVWMTSRGNANRGTDYWVMKLDGSGKRRITDFNNPRLPGFRRRAITAADHSFAPDGKRFVAYLQSNLLTQDGMTVILSLDTARTAPF